MAGPQTMVSPTPVPRVNRLSIVSLCVAVLALVLAPLIEILPILVAVTSFVLGGVAYRRVMERAERGRLIAVWAIVLSLLSAFLAVVMLYLSLVFDAMLKT